MKPYRSLLWMWMAVASFSCSKEAAEDPETPAALEVRVGGVSLITRAGIDDVNDVSHLGVFAVNKVAGETDYGVAPEGFYGKYKLTSGVAAPEDPSQTVWLQLQKATIYSFHPALTPIPEGTASAPDPKIAVPASAIPMAPAIPALATADQLDFALAENDYMYGVAYNSAGTTEAEKFPDVQPVADNGHTDDGSRLNISGREVAIGLKHAFAQVILNIQKGDTYQGEAVVSRVEYQRNMCSVSANTKMSVKTGTFEGMESLAQRSYVYDLSGLNTPLRASSTGIPIVNYAMPNTDKSRSVIRVTVDGKPMILENNSEVAWQAGIIYTYTLRIIPTGLELAGFNVMSWDAMPVEVGDIDI